MFDKWFEAEDLARDVLLATSTLIPHDRAQGMYLAFGMAVAGWALDTAYAVEQTVKLPFRAIGMIE